MPDFDDSKWDVSSPITDGLEGAGIGFYRTTVTIDVPKGYDVVMSFKFADEDRPYRVEMWVNGWQMGRRVANLGCVASSEGRWTELRIFGDRPQVHFPVQEGILDYHGTKCVCSVALLSTLADRRRSTVALALWAMEESGAKIGSFELSVDTVLQGGIGRIRSDNPSVRHVGGRDAPLRQCMRCLWVYGAILEAS